MDFKDKFTPVSRRQARNQAPAFPPPLPLHSPADVCHPGIPLLFGTGVNFIHFWSF